MEKDQTQAPIIGDRENFFVLPTPKDVPGKRLYCGPTVIAMLTGASREEIFAKVNRQKNKRLRKYPDFFKKKRMKDMVKGMHNHQLEDVLRRFGVTLSKHKKPASGKYLYGSLRQFEMDYGHFKKPIIINITHHYVLFFRGMIFDTYRREGTPLNEHPLAGRRVESFWIVERQKAPGISKPAEEAPAPAVEKPKRDIRRERFEIAKDRLKDWTQRQAHADKHVKKWAAKVKRYEKIFQGGA